MKSPARALGLALALLAAALVLFALLLRDDGGGSAAAGAVPSDLAPRDSTSPPPLGLSTADSGASAGRRAPEDGFEREAAATAAEPHPLPSGTVSGRVTDGDGAPVAGARVALRVRRATDSLTTARATTDGDGRYAVAIEALAALSTFERQLMRVEAAAELGASCSLSEERRVFDARGCVADLDLVLHSGVSVRGRALDESGRPVEGAKVRGDRGSGWFGLRPVRASTDAGGDFTLPLEPDLGAVVVAAGGVGWARAAFEAPRPGECVDVGTLVLRPLGVISGRVVDELGRPVGGVVVAAALLRAASAPGADADGADSDERRALFERLRAAGVEVDESSVVIRHKASGDELVLPGADGGAGIAGAPQASTVTADDGRFTLAGLVEGRYELRATPAALGEADTGETGVELALRGAWLHVRVLDERGRPLPDFEVCGTYVDGDPEGPARPDLRLACEGAPADAFEPVAAPARVALRIATRAAEPRLEVVELGPGVTHVTLVARPAASSGRLRIVLRAPGGSQWFAYSVHLRRSGTDEELASYYAFDTDEDDWSPELPCGTFDVEVVPEAARSGGEPDLLPVELRGVTLGARSNPQFELVTRRGARLTLTLDTGAAPPRPGSARLRAVDARGHARRLTCSPGLAPSSRGAERLERSVSIAELLAPGRTTIEAELEGFAPASATITLVEGGDNELRLALERK